MRKFIGVKHLLAVVVFLQLVTDVTSQHFQELLDRSKRQDQVSICSIVRDPDEIIDKILATVIPSLSNHTFLNDTWRLMQYSQGELEGLETLKRPSSCSFSCSGATVSLSFPLQLRSVRVMYKWKFLLESAGILEFSADRLWLKGTLNQAGTSPFSVPRLDEMVIEQMDGVTLHTGFNGKSILGGLLDGDSGFIKELEKAMSHVARRSIENTVRHVTIKSVMDNSVSLLN